MRSIIRFAGILFIFLTVAGLIVPCHASDINIVGTVTPASGKEDTNFTYSAVIDNIGGNYDVIGALNIKLIVSDNRVNKSFSQHGKFQGNGLSPEELIRGSSDPYTFSFNPGREGLKNIDELSYEFVLTAGSGKELARNKYPGPKIVIAPEFQSLQYSKVPYYYFQEFPITLTFNDKPNVIPSLQLSIQGPLNSSEETKWTEDLAARTAGTTHTFSKALDLTQFPEGGNFSFNFTYNDFREKEGYEPITSGPYYFNILPYSPKIVEPVSLAKQIEYNNFSLRVSVEDEGAVLVGDAVGSSASLIITHPTKGEMVFDSSGSLLQGKYLVFEWDKNSVPFEKSDVLQSKKEPLRAHLKYWNENRNYGADSSNYTFNLVNVTPLLTETHEPVLHMTGSETARESIRAYVTYARGMGDLKIGVTGPDGYYENIVKGSLAGANKYQYDWSRMFNSSQAGNYTLSFTYLHDSLEGGSYEFDKKPEYSFQVVPIFIEFLNGNVSPSRGMWNGSYSYTIEANSSVEADAILQIFNPCSSEWVDAGGARKIKAGASNISWMIQPFAYECDELDSGKYRFKANYQGRDFSSTRVYEGPDIINEDVQLSSLEYSRQQVIPANGSAFTGFTYSVLPQSDVQKFDVELLTQEPGSIIWTSQGTVPYNSSVELLTWPNIRIEGSEFGEAKYRFRSGTSTSEIFKGPTIEPIAFINSTVSPSHGPQYDTTPLKSEISRVYMYIIEANISKSLGSDLKEIRLEIYDPSSGSWLPGGSQTYNASNKPISFKVNFAELAFQETFLGETRHRFLANDKVLGEFSGPIIDVNLRNETMIKLGNNRTYEVDIRSSLPKVDIAISYTIDALNWIKGDIRTYQSSAQEWKTLQWKDYPSFYAMEFEVVYV